MKSKSYSDYMNAITPDELYEGLLSYGFFTDKLPPIFTAQSFFDYCEHLKKPFSDIEHDFVFFESMRNTNVPRVLGIPTPMAYQRLCTVLRDNWKEIQNYFKEKTKGELYKISRIHIRKWSGTKSLFKMNYKDFKNDNYPFPKYLIGKKYKVYADISTCFPSIYTHSIPWALLGKENAKNNRYKGWQNDIDKECRYLRNGETHGLLIGPHASNLISEIILTAVDQKLANKHWDYLRNIDDYTCYVSSRKDADCFLRELGENLRYFDLTLNHTKTTISELPIASTKHWIRQLNSMPLVSKYGKVNYTLAQSYLDGAIKLFYENDMDSAVLNYAIKVLSNQKMSENAKEYCAYQIMHLAFIYPYLIPLLDQYVFDAFSVNQDDIISFSNLSYEQNKLISNNEGMYYSIYFALKYEFELVVDVTDDAVKSDSCLLKLFAWLYCKKRNDKDGLKKLKNHAMELKKIDTDFDRNWIFLYECLPVNYLCDEWEQLKNEKVSFISQKYL